MSLLQRFTPQFVLMTIITEKESEGKYNILGLSEEQEASRNLPNVTPVLLTLEDFVYISVASLG